MKNIKNILINVIPILLVVIGFSCLLFNPTRPNGKSIYLSDITPVSSSVGNGELKINKNSQDGPITLIVDGEKVSFDKGLGAHASSTIIYDLSSYKEDYTRIYGYLGVDASAEGNGDGVIFAIYGSNDNNQWVLLLNSNSQKGNSEAKLFDVDVSEYNYIKFYASKNGTSDYDYAVYADLRLLSSDYNVALDNYEGILTVEEYDKELSLNKVDYNIKYRKTIILRREFVDRYGYQTIQNAIRRSDDVKDAIEWLLSDNDNLSLLLECGDFQNGQSRQTLNVLGELYAKHKNDFVAKDGAVYKKMMLATAVAYSKTIKSFASSYGGTNVESSALKKYEAFKYLYDYNKLNNKEAFKNLNPELMRMVMDARMEDDEIIWLNLYASIMYGINIVKKYDGSSYLEYKQPNFLNPDYYNLDNKDTYSSKYRLDLNNSSILNSFGDESRIRLWMVMESGCLNWGISGLSVNLNEVFGIPASNIYQSGNDAYIVYKQNEDGQGYFELLNSTSTWFDTFSKLNGNSQNEVRMLLNYGIRSYNDESSSNGSYLVLALSVLNDYSNYYHSCLYNWLANSYDDYSHKLECYKNALKYSPLNLDSYDGMYDMYASNTSFTDTEWYTFAEDIINAYTYYPMAMYEQLERIKSNLRDDTLKVSIDILLNEALIKASNATQSDCLSYNVSRSVANGLITSKDTTLAKFSFSGENANSIVINSLYDDLNVTIRYSIDGGKTFKDSTEHSIKLTSEELNMINSNDDIIVTLLGSLSDYKIDILDGEVVQASKTVMNDEENTFVGEIELLEFSTDGGMSWASYDPSIRFMGDVDVAIRIKAHDNSLYGPSVTYTFTTDTDTESAKYVTVDHISIAGVSSAQNGRGAELAIDANPLTSWHTTFNTTDEDRFIIVKFDEAMYISKIVYQSSNVNGRIKVASIYYSLDGVNFEKALTTDVLPNNTNPQNITIQNSVYCSYIKIVADSTYGNTQGEYDKYFSAIGFSFYQDLTKLEP